ncbi:hypothetical protein BGZ70_002016 [Mortierella alpina]|uniref:Translation initiation factor IF-3 n=1 Tax=Mortierella alpina TaxID=64518 RepID=A0A9P6IUW2_MORAP|nr:hypothetical protein BGZ70_002016 [Mortierella alpina]
MIPAVRQTTSSLARRACPSQWASYTTRSNGAAFLNNLDFLAPSPSSRASASAPSQSQSQLFQPQRNNVRRPQPSQGNRDFLRSTAGSKAHAIDDIDPDSNNSGRQPSRRTGKFSSEDDSSWASERNRSAARRDLDKRPALDRPRRDEEINSPWIQYVTPEGNQGEKSLARVLRSFDRSQFFLVEVDAGAFPPICKLFSKKELYEKAKAAKQAKKANELPTKELQLNWGTDPHDLNHKLSKFRAFLEKGHRVEIQVNGKKGKSTTPPERELVMERIKAEFEPVSKYVKQPEWVKATTVTMMLQGLAKKPKTKKQKAEAP